MPILFFQVPSEKRRSITTPVKIEVRPIYLVNVERLAEMIATPKYHFFFSFMYKIRKMKLVIDKNMNNGSDIAPVKLSSKAGDTRKIIATVNAHRVDWEIRKIP